MSRLVDMYTRRGDKGETSLYGRRRVSKDAARVEAYGTIDELSSVIGVAVAQSKSRRVTSSLKEVQRMLFVAGADSASDTDSHGIPRITSKETRRVEIMTDELLKELPSLRNFILPGGTTSAALIHLARSVCRRAERRIIAASKEEDLNPELVPFFNRLSSFLFNLSRYSNMKAGKAEETWKS